MRDRVDDNVAIEIHDSTLECIESDGDALVAVFSAYVHRSSGRPGIDPGTGWSQTFHLRFRRGRASGNVDMVPIELLGGHVDASNERFENVIPMPFNHVGPAMIELHGWNGIHIVLEGEGVEATLIGEARYIETFSASEDSTK